MGMSIPRRDPNFTMAELQKAGDAFMQAGMRYWEAVHRAGLRGGAVVWIGDSDGQTAIFTRSEYRETLMNNIHRLGPTTVFGATDDA